VDTASRPRSLSGEFERLCDAFVRVHGGAAPERTFFAPGRVNLMGAHLDYNGGPVMPTAIDRGTLIAMRPRSDRKLVLASTVEPHRLSISLDDLPKTAAGTWTDYPVGVLAHLLPGAPDAQGMDVLVGGNLPIGAGLSSSASVCVGAAFALEAMWGLSAGSRGWIRAALFSEREFVGVQCGIMDPYAVALTRPGHLLWLDCADESYEHVPLDSGETRICVADTGIRRELARGDFNRRVEECGQAFAILRRHVPGARFLRDVPPEVVEEHSGELGPTLHRRARHVTTEVQRAFQARKALDTGDVGGFGEAMSAAHRSLREDYEVSVPELDHLVDTALTVEGVHGARLTGAGFGGCIVALCRAGSEGALEEALVTAFRARFGTSPTVETFRSDAGPREVDGS